MTQVDAIADHAPARRSVEPYHLGYALGIAGPMLGWVAAGQYLLFFYTEVLGLKPAQAGLVFAFGLVWDAISDPLIGAAADRTRTRWGRYRPWLLWSAVPYALSLPLAFSSPPAGINALAWAFVTHTIFRTLYSFVYMPYTAMLAAIAPGYDERTDLTSWKTAVVKGTNLLVSIGFYSLVLTVGQHRSALGFPLAGAVLGVAAVASVWVCFRATRGRERLVDLIHEPTRPRVILRDLIANRPFLLLFAGVLIYGGFYAAQISMTSYIAKYWMADAGVARWLFAVEAVLGLASIPLWNRLGRSRGKRTVWLAGAGLAAFGLLAIFFIRPTNGYVLAGFYGISNMGSTAFIIVMFAMTADTVDWGGARLGRRHEGIIFGAIALANKLANGVFAGLAGAALALVGFVSNQTPSAATLDGLFLIALAAPAVGYLLSIAVIWRYPISRQVHAGLTPRAAALTPQEV